jgi:hypothetical protein
MILGQVLAAKVRLIVWRKACEHQVEPDGATPVEWSYRSPPVSTRSTGPAAAPGEAL